MKKLKDRSNENKPESGKGVTFWKIGILAFLLAGIIIASGCVGNETPQGAKSSEKQTIASQTPGVQSGNKAPAATAPKQTNIQKKDDRVADYDSVPGRLVMKPEDFPDLSFGGYDIYFNRFEAVHTINALNRAGRSGYSIPVNTKKVGEYTLWISESDLGATIYVNIYRLGNDSGLKERHEKELNNCQNISKSFDVKCESLGIGDYSSFDYEVSGNGRLQTVGLEFFKGSEWALISDRKQNKEEMIRIARIIESRMNGNIFGMPGDTANAQPNAGMNTAGFLVKPGDVPQMALKEYDYYATDKDAAFTADTFDGAGEYTGALPTKYRKVGEYTRWADDGARSVMVRQYKFDSDSGINEYFANEIKACKSINVECNSLGIGDNSKFIYTIMNGRYEANGIEFSKGNNHVYIVVSAEKEKIKEESLRIAKLVEGRLN